MSDGQVRDKGQISFLKIYLGSLKEILLATSSVPTLAKIKYNKICRIKHSYYSTIYTVLDNNHAQ